MSDNLKKNLTKYKYRWKFILLLSDTLIKVTSHTDALSLFLSLFRLTNLVTIFSALYRVANFVLRKQRDLCTTKCNFPDRSADKINDPQFYEVTTLLGTT